jgi:hypothetical protein
LTVILIGIDSNSASAAILAVPPAAVYSHAIILLHVVQSVLKGWP